MRKVFIQTYGCQMNEYDTEQMLQVLATKGFEKASSPESAHLIIINSCSVREKSENKALSQLGRFAALKKKDASKVLAFGGCVGQTEGTKLQSRYPFLDLVFGTNNYRDLPDMISSFEDQWPTAEDEEVLLPRSRPESKTQAFITITNGCDKFCSYCIVPFTRGREISRSPEEILAEASALTQKGVNEIMLLGQNVNSYWGKNKQGAFTSLYDLLVLFQEESSKSLKGLKRLRYTTSHPRDFDENLARAFSELPILCEYLHLPFQSGSDSVLRKMRRFYTADTYLKKIEMVKKYRPDIALSTDIIVGFPGETRKDFEDTLRVIKEVEFDNIYSFKYSVRPYTRSEKWIDDVPAQEKADRIQELILFQREIGRRKYREDIGTSVEMMMEGPSKGDSAFWTGRTRKNRVVHLPADESFKIGQIRFAHIFDATHSWLSGKLVANPVTLLSEARQIA
jgi:tRNA-2-methylthio-N6-dimethylallyladenosine synthase